MWSRLTLVKGYDRFFYLEEDQRFKKEKVKLAIGCCASFISTLLVKVQNLAAAQVR